MKDGYFDKAGRRMTMLDWAKRSEDMTYRRIAVTTLPNSIRVSTVWLGLDHRFGDGPPLIFESMAFSEKGVDLDCERYSTEAEARDGHEVMVKKWEAQP